MHLQCQRWPQVAQGTTASRMVARARPPLFRCGSPTAFQARRLPGRTRRRGCQRAGPAARSAPRRVGDKCL